MKMEILVGSDQFMARLQQDVRHAKKNVYIQAMTFEADGAGNALYDMLASSEAADIRLLVDSYIKAMISDKFLYTPKNMLNRSLRQEYRDTLSLIDKLNQTGKQAKLINPLGPLLMGYTNRNHKKLITIDDHISYIGGMNFSDHNFSWHDMMVRIDQEDLATFLKQDFLMTWSGKNQSSKQSFKDVDVVVFDGTSNEENFESIFTLIDQAQESIVIESPYLTFPFFDKLRQASKRGVAVSLICPEENNKTIIQKYTFWEAQQSNMTLRLLNEMTHLKALLIDDTSLLIGSSNFDYISYRSQQELIAIIHNREAINAFKKEVIEKDWERSYTWTGNTPHLSGFMRYVLIRAGCSLAVRLNRTYNRWRLSTA